MGLAGAGGPAAQASAVCLFAASYRGGARSGDARASRLSSSRLVVAGGADFPARATGSFACGCFCVRIRFCKRGRFCGRGRFRAATGAAGAGGAVGRGDGVGVQGHSSGLRQQPAMDRGACGRGDARPGHDRADETRARPQRRGGADLPEHVARLRAVDQLDSGVRARGQLGADLEDEYSIRVTLRVEGDSPG